LIQPPWGYSGPHEFFFAYGDFSLSMAATLRMPL